MKTHTPFAGSATSHELTHVTDQLEGLNFRDPSELVQFFYDLQEPSAQEGAMFDREKIIDTFRAHGYSLIVDTGIQFDRDGYENSARDLIGHALYQLRVRGVISPSFLVVTRKWQYQSGILAHAC